MKFLLVLAAVGLSTAEPEADPAFAYSVGGLHAPLVYSAGLVHPYALGYGYPYALAASGCRNDAGALVPCAQGVLPYVTHGVLGAAPAAADETGVEEARKKREADAEADPAVLYSSSVVKNPVPALTYYAPYAHHLGAYAHYGAYGLGGYGLWGRKKREADAEPEADADAEADPYLAYGYGYPLTYSHAAYHPYALHAGCRNYLGALVPCGRKKREAEAEADAEADPWLAYGYGYPYAYSHAAYHPYAYALGGCRNYLGGLVPCAGR